MPNSRESVLWSARREGVPFNSRMLRDTRSTEGPRVRVRIRASPCVGNGRPRTHHPGGCAGRLRVAARDGRGSAGFRLPERQPVCARGPQESELLREKAFVLFGKLATLVGISRRRFFKEEVKRAWVALMLHCRDPCSSTAQVCVPEPRPCPLGKAL